MEACQGCTFVFAEEKSEIRVITAKTLVNVLVLTFFSTQKEIKKIFLPILLSIILLKCKCSTNEGGHFSRQHKQMQGLDHQVGSGLHSAARTC